MAASAEVVGAQARNLGRNDPNGPRYSSAAVSRIVRSVRKAARLQTMITAFSREDPVWALSRNRKIGVVTVAIRPPPQRGGGHRRSDLGPRHMAAAACMFGSFLPGIDCMNTVTTISTISFGDGRRLLKAGGGGHHLPPPWFCGNRASYLFRCALFLGAPCVVGQFLHHQFEGLQLQVGPARRVGGGDRLG